MDETIGGSVDRKGVGGTTVDLDPYTNRILANID